MLAGELVLCPAGLVIAAVLESLSKSPPAAPRCVQGRTETRAPGVAHSPGEHLLIETAIPWHCQGESCCRHGGTWAVGET